MFDTLYFTFSTIENITSYRQIENIVCIIYMPSYSPATFDVQQ